MIRGTTPTHVFDIPFDTALVKEARITYAQENQVIVDKKTEDCTMSGNTISVTLTQEDTLKFDHACMAEVQLKVLAEGCVMAMPVKTLSIDKILNEEVLL